MDVGLPVDASLRVDKTSVYRCQLGLPAGYSPCTEIDVCPSVRPSVSRNAWLIVLWNQRFFDVLITSGSLLFTVYGYIYYSRLTRCVLYALIYCRALSTLLTRSRHDTIWLSVPLLWLNFGFSESYRNIFFFFGKFTFKNAKFWACLLYTSPSPRD